MAPYEEERVLIALPGFYKTDHSKTVCMLVVNECNNGEPYGIIISPGRIVQPDFYKFDLPLFSWVMECMEVENSSLVDYINAIAMCMIQWNITPNIYVGAELGDEYIIYCPANDTVYESFFTTTNNSDLLEALKAECIVKLQDLRAEISAPGPRKFNW